ncbi:hypothetical protein ABGB07_04640 [Micromonosporaceae bacterium B7E4]
MSDGSAAASGGSPPADNPPRICSARGCRAAAVWALHWNNPRLHTAQRRKTWLACAEHRRALGDFLGARGFLREVTPAEGSPTLDT